MSYAIDTLEHMFEYEQVSPVSASAASATAEGLSAAERVAELQARIGQMQSRTLSSKLIPTHPAIASLLPGGGLQQGSVYSVDSSAMLLMTLLAAPSAAGSWCAVVGVPEFGIEAAHRFGVDLERLVLVPHPGDQWMAVTAAIADVVDVVVARPPRRASDSAVARLASRLRQRKSTLLMVGSWPQSEAMLSLGESHWHGIGDGHGHLAAREVTITVTSKSTGRPRSARVWLPDAAQTVRSYSAADSPAVSDVAPPQLRPVQHRVSA
ncbi:hypothetical protein ESZ53_02515 [Salinibacterium sp. UTAS2018]|nr:hypothetical protein ESZ53_02515 [Salinibacterium sp. UTAS2018]